MVTGDDEVELGGDAGGPVHLESFEDPGSVFGEVLNTGTSRSSESQLVVN